MDEGLIGDHTDGHIDNIARFVAPGRVVCQAPSGADDPNASILDAIAARLREETDSTGRKLEVITIPGAGLYKNTAGEVSPASHMNFIIANGVVVVPVYGTATQDAALIALQDVFPDRRSWVSRRAGCSVPETPAAAPSIASLSRSRGRPRAA